MSPTTKTGIGRSPLSFAQKSQLQPYPDKVAVGSESFSVVTSHDNKLFGAQASFSSEAMAHEFLRDQLTLDPSLLDTLHVLPNHEVNLP